MGPGGALVILLFLGRMGFKFLTDLISKQDVRYESLCREFKTLNTHTLEHIAAQTTATALQTEALRRLTEVRKVLKSAS